MAMHQFRPGDRVKLRSLSSANTAEAFLDLMVPAGVRKFTSDAWEVMRLLPPDGTGAQYHVRSERDGMQRRVHEEQLAPVH
ncbi:hypothetical protein [Microvirga sp. G4-2]|uniref:hypothetical protein n=1 Tax=Microvirga sp. G4-2 TaxID=3434467 RepID=UPI004043BA8D